MADPQRSVSPEEANNYLEFVKKQIKLVDNMSELKNNGLLNEIDIAKKITVLMIEMYKNVS